MPPAMVFCENFLQPGEVEATTGESVRTLGRKFDGFRVFFFLVETEVP